MDVQRELVRQKEQAVDWLEVTDISALRQPGSLAKSQAQIAWQSLASGRVKLWKAVGGSRPSL
jgi:hypothetical protein